MSKEALITWLRQQQSKLEDILLQSAEEYYRNYSSNRTFEYDAKQTGKELWLLGRGEDLCYDRPTIGFNYSLWYHPKRINTFLRYFTDLIYNSRTDNRIEIFDLGAGTGAVLWATGLIVQGLKTVQLPCPKIRVINIDTSPFMITYNRDFLWKNFIREFPLAEEIAKENDYRLNSWTNIDADNCTNVWICASYLFDHSENSQAIAEDFHHIVEKYKPNKVLLLSARQKSAFVDSVATSIHQLNFSSRNQILDSQIFSGQLPRLYQFRNRISQQHNLELTGIPKWDIDSLYGRVLINNRPQLLYALDHLNIFVPPEKNRAKIKLTPQQEEAASVGDRPTLVVGPAGCGKSVVLTEKVKNIVEANSYSSTLKLLVTTFNKGLVKYLGDWIQQLLDPTKAKRIFGTNFYGYPTEYSFFRFGNSPTWNVYVMHFDILPTKIGGVISHNVAANGSGIEEFHFNTMSRAIETFVSANGITRTDYAKILNPEFLLDEYQRIIYGFECNSEKSYQTIERTGRGNNPQLRYKSKRRKIVWGIIRTYLQNLKQRNLESFTIRRHRLIKKLRANGFPTKFTHVIVDEFQDCTKADYEIFYLMLQDPNNITFAGDLAQSINLGTSLHFPLRTDNPNMRRFDTKRLTGSFRLPMRISECIKPFSEIVNRKFQDKLGMGIDIISPYKGAPPGSRPILIYAVNTVEATAKIHEVFHAYKTTLQLENVTIFEKDYELNTALNANKVTSTTEIILRTKGLEKKCVVWSTRINVDTETEKEEFIYTILTRTVSLLIIVVFPGIQQTYIDIIKSFVAERLIHWDEISEQQYQIIRRNNLIADNRDDIDNSEDNQEEDDENIDNLIS